MYIFKLGGLPQEKAFHFGGKADSLNRMINAGLPVPQGYAIAAEGFENGKPKRELVKELAELVQKLNNKYTYAVRSSAIGEDGAKTSFAGAYRTVIDVKPCDIENAVCEVAASCLDERVSVYACQSKSHAGNIAVVIQRFIVADYAGVIFTVDPILADRGRMTGSMVKGAGEKLVSGDGSDGEFTINCVKFAYDGCEEMRQYAKKLFKCATKAAALYGCPQDIEWVVANGKVYIPQSRPITTLFENNYGQFDVNDSLCGRYLLSKTNVGEIFCRPVSPMTYGLIRKICDLLGFNMISNVCGQLYLNISGVCSMLCSFGLSTQKAYSIICEIAGGLPDGVEIPIFPYKKSLLFGRIWQVIVSSFGKKRGKADFGKQFNKRIPQISMALIDEINAISDKTELLAFWHERGEPFMKKAFSAIITGLSVKSLFSSRQQLERVCSTELADRLLSNSSCGGSIESLGTLLAIDDVINGKMTKEEYSLRYGHRHADEMELIVPYPYESADFPDNVIEEYKNAGINAYALKSAKEDDFNNALKEFEKMYPQKVGWLNKLLKKYSAAVAGRERIRSEALRMFCMIRAYLLKAAQLLGLGEDIFMLYIEEVLDILGGGQVPMQLIAERREIYERQLKMPGFPSVILGRFTIKEWQASGANSGFYCFGGKCSDESGNTIKGIAGSCGQVEGLARVISSIDECGSLQKGEILVVPAANIGWVKLFPKVSAIVTDIGAPLSHAVIVARELGIPAVVSCRYASGAIKTGDKIRVDGTAGVVTIIERKQ